MLWHLLSESSADRGTICFPWSKPWPRHMLQSYAGLASASPRWLAPGRVFIVSVQVLGLKHWRVTQLTPNPFRRQLPPLLLPMNVRRPHLQFTNWRNSPRALHKIHTWTQQAARDGGRKKGRQQGMNGWIDGESEGRWRQREEREKCWWMGWWHTDPLMLQLHRQWLLLAW